MMKMWRALKQEGGVVAILVAFLIIVFIGVAALAIDIALIHLGKNELQKAADAGALAGARNLYFANGSIVNIEADAIAVATATANNTFGGISAEAEAERGHWSFGAGLLERGFYPNNSTDPINLTLYTTLDLDGMVDYINAVRVFARRDTVLLPAFFSRLFNHLGFRSEAVAVAWLGFAGSVDAEEIDFPLSLCREVVVKQTADGEVVDCTTGRVLSSDQTARWTNFVQPCGGAASSGSVDQLMRPCGSGNPEQVYLNQGVSTTHGVQANNVDTLRDCWLAADLEQQEVPRGTGAATSSFPAEPWTLKLLVVSCTDDDATPTCVNPTGVVVANVLWVTNPSNSSYAPLRMKAPLGFDDWPLPEEEEEIANSDYETRWDSFANHFNLRDEDGSLATLEPGEFTVYFHMDCDIHEPTGDTGGLNSGLMAKIPRLVQ